MFHPQLYSLHGIYLTQLRPIGGSISLGDIQTYLHKLPWQRISFLMKKIINQEIQAQQQLSETISQETTSN